MNATIQAPCYFQIFLKLLEKLSVSTTNTEHSRCCSRSDAVPDAVPNLFQMLSSDISSRDLQSPAVFTATKLLKETYEKLSKYYCAFGDEIKFVVDLIRKRSGF